MSQNIRVTDSIDHKKWADFVYNHLHENIFQTHEMREVYERTKNYEPITLVIMGDTEEILTRAQSAMIRMMSGILAHLKRCHDSFCAGTGVCKT